MVSRRPKPRFCLLFDLVAPFAYPRSAEQLAIRAPTASDAVSALVRKGLLEKKSDPADGRAIRLQLTPSGVSQADSIAEWPDILLRSVHVLTLTEQAVLLRALIKMIRELQIQGAIAPARMCATCQYFQPFAHEDLDTPHHCRFVDAAFGDRHLRVDCAEHEPAPEAEADALWSRFSTIERTDVIDAGQPT